VRSKAHSKSKVRATSGGQPGAGWFPWLLISLGALAMYAPTLNLPFLGDDYVFQMGKAVSLRPGRDVTIISTGMMTPKAKVAVGPR